MDMISRDELKPLMGKQNGLCVSIFLPTNRVGATGRQDLVVFKNLLRKAEERLIACGSDILKARNLLEPAQKLVKIDRFWRYQSLGVAMFLSTDLFRHYSLPVEPASLVIVAHRFMLSPCFRS
jgi:hypothetical protein